MWKPKAVQRILSIFAILGISTALRRTITTESAEFDDPITSFCQTDGDCKSVGENLYCRFDYNVTNGTCACSVPNPENSTACLPWREEEQSCQTDSECNRKLGLSCVEGVCNCDPETTVRNSEYKFLVYTQGHLVMKDSLSPTPAAGFYPVHGGQDWLELKPIRADDFRPVLVGECLRRPGFTCDFSPHSALAHRICVQQATCNSTSGLCECREPDSKLTGSGVCGVGYGGECEATNVCRDDLRCVYEDYFPATARCRCPQGDSLQLYSEEEQVCQGYLDAPCDLDDALSCVKLSTCTNTTYGPRCQCGNGTVGNNYGLCEIQFGFPCDYRDNVVTVPGNLSTFGSVSDAVNHGVLCNQAAKLVCRTGPEARDGFKCACPNESDVFDEGRNRCYKPEGTRCSRDHDWDSTGDNYNGNGACAPKCNCEIKSGTDWGICVCPHE